MTSVNALLARCAALTARIDASERAIQAAALERLAVTTDQAEVAVLRGVLLLARGTLVGH